MDEKDPRMTMDKKNPCANCGHVCEGRAYIGDTAYGNTIDDSDCDYEDDEGCNEENGFKGWIPREEESPKWFIPKIAYTMGGEMHELCVNRYGKRYFFRDRNVLSKTRCSFSIKVEDLKKILQQADDNPAEVGDVMWMEMTQDDTQIKHKTENIGTLDMFDEEEGNEE